VASRRASFASYLGDGQVAALAVTPDGATLVALNLTGTSTIGEIAIVRIER
jgi:hypothetical protein